MNDDAEKLAIKQALRLEDLVRESGIELKKQGHDLAACCPFHNEKTPSFTVHPGEQFFKCFGCGKSGDVLSWIAWTMFKTLEPDADQFKAVMERGRGLTGIQRKTPAAPEKPKTVYPTKEKLTEAVNFVATGKSGKIGATYEYTNPETRALDLIVYRLESPSGKTFLQAHPCPGGFCMGGLPVTPLYNRARVAASKVVVVVEGEKCVHALHETGHVATTSPGGSNGALKADWKPLAGKVVVIWPDADEPGDKYAAEVQSALARLSPPPTVSVIVPSAHGLKDGDDAADVVHRSGPMLANKIEAVNLVLASAAGTGPVARLHAILNDAKSGKRLNVEFCWPGISKATQALVPGSVCVLCGSPGATKSLACVQNFIWWKNRQVGAAGMMLEDGVSLHLRRGMAQITGHANVTNDEWCRNNAETVTMLQENCDQELAGLAAMLDDPGDQPVTVEFLLEWLRRRVERDRIGLIDPVTLMQRGKTPWADDDRFMAGAKRIIERAEASLLLVTHPRRLSSGKERVMELDELAGGMAYSRFAHCVLYLTAHAPKESSVMTTMGRADMVHNRTMSIMKARNGEGTGWKFAMRFNKETLTLGELGEIVD